MTTAVFGQHVTGAMSYSAFAINNKGKMRALAVALDKRHPLLPDMPTFKELGFDWVDGAYRGIGMPKSTPAEARKHMSDLWAALNADPEMKELAFKNGFELVNVGDRENGTVHGGTHEGLHGSREAARPWQVVGRRHGRHRSTPRPAPGESFDCSHLRSLAC